MKKISHTVLSTHKCLRCGKSLKQNLINKRPLANLCYKCHRIANGKPAHHVARRKRVDLHLPVHGA